MSRNPGLIVAAGLAVSLGAVFAPPLPVAMARPQESAPPDSRQVVKTSDDLPRHLYHIEGKASEFVLSDKPFRDLAAKVRADCESDLAKYRIEDPTTLQGYYNTLQQIALLEGRNNQVREFIDKIRDLEAKPSKKMMTGQVITSLIAAEEQTGEKAGQLEFDAAFKRELESRIRALPWEVVRESVMQSKGTSLIITRELVLGQIKGQLDVIVEQAKGEISGDLARQLVGMRTTLDKILPLQPLLADVYTRVIEEKESKSRGEDIWTPNLVTLTEADHCHPVVIGIWDSGVDVSLFPGQLYVNPEETPGNNKDDDGNGFVDDDHGIAYDLEANRVAGPLANLSELGTPREEMGRFDKAFSDLRNNIQSAEADSLRRHMRGLKSDQVTPFLEDLGLYGNYCHGTHVAGIAAAGNPCARILYARITFDFRSIPTITPTVEQARKEAQATLDTIAYFRKAGVRVVNMSFGGSRQDIEDALEAKNAGGSPEERASMAREIFKIGRDAADEAMRGAPEILFIAAAGNADNDNEFSEVLPSCLNLPNMITVGAIDQTGKPTGFTTFGKNVRLYANGFEVESLVPGGEKRKYSGTSMAAPNAANLAAKLLAINPKLTTQEVIDLMTSGADPMEGHDGRLIINPRKTIGMARQRD